MLRILDMLNTRQKISLAFLPLVFLLLFFIFELVAERVHYKVSKLPAIVRASDVSAHINGNSAIYDMLGNANPQYVPKNILEGADAGNFTEYFGQ